MEEIQKDSIVSEMKNLVSKLGFEAEVGIMEDVQRESENGNLICDIKVSSDSHILIGQYGTNLQALQHIARLIVRKKTSDKVNFIVDVNSYRQEKNQSILELAKLAANQALEEKRTVVMKPMTAYERRLVHIELSKNDAVITESIGEGEDRKIVVKPAESL